MATVLATGADERYGNALLNLLGSIHANSPGTFDRIVAYDLGLSRFQRRLLEGLRGVEVRTVPPFVSHWRQGFTWKPWIWTHLDSGEDVLWIDAGATVLRPLDPAFEQIRERGYFLVSQGWVTRALIPSDYYPLYGLSEESLGDRHCVAAGIIGFRVGSPFYEHVVVPTYEDCLLGRNVGFSPDEATTLNFGMQRAAEVTVRNCWKFRHDQSILNIRLALAMPDAHVNDLDQYAGWQSRRDHPEQLIWSHRRNGSYGYLVRVPYRLRVRPIGFGYGAYRAARRWWQMHRWLGRPQTFTRRAATIVRALRRT